ncbi:MAG TPA: glycosyltransferase [bacterium]|nr:glycosyltransferase [bacterium]
MRALLISSGSRGDFQPLLALAVALKERGHDPLLTGGTSYAAEAAAFGIPFRVVGMDVKTWMEENHKELDMNPANGAWQLLRQVRREFGIQLEQCLPLARDADVVVGAGAVLAAPTVADAAKKPYVFVAYTPQVFRTRHLAPFLFPVGKLPGPMNAALWQVAKVIASVTVRPVLDSSRARLGLGYVDDLQEHLFSTRHAILASDSELCPVPPDIALRRAPVGSLELPDDRPLGPEIEAFLDAGPPPVYVGFGSMPDPEPARTTRILVDAIRGAGVRALLSRGWAGFAQGEKLPPEILPIGPVSHRTLFPRCAAIVHHGGAGTTHAALRAGVPQAIVPHAFDQFQFAHWAERAGVAVPMLPRTRLSWRGLSERIAHAVSDGSIVERAREAGLRVRARRPLEEAVRHVEAALR